MTDIDFRIDEKLSDEIEQPRRIELVDPMTGSPIIDIDGKPAFVTLYSALSRKFRTQAHKIHGRASNLGKKTGGNLPFEVQEKLEAQIYACAFGDEWHIVKKRDGKYVKLDAPCTFENATNWILGNPLMKTQLSAKTDNLQSFVDGDDGNFTTEALSPSTKASKTASN